MSGCLEQSRPAYRGDGASADADDDDGADDGDETDGGGVVVGEDVARRTLLFPVG